MNEKRNMLYISAGINFAIGTVLGIILFYGQMKSIEEVETIYEYDKTISLSDFFRLSWLNILWMLSVFFARCILPLGAFHPIVAMRGTISSFSMLYILTEFGVKEVVASLVPQCVSVLPLLLFFSVETVVKYHTNIQSGYEACSLKKHEVAMIFVLSMLSGAAEVLFFKLFCNYLF